MLPSMWTSIYYELSPEDAVRRIAEVGWPAIELSTEHLVVLREDADSSRRVAAFSRLVDECGLKLDQAHITISVDIASLDDAQRERDQTIVLRDIEVLSALGIHNGVLHPGGYGALASAELGRRQNELRVAAITRLAEAATKADVRLALENGVKTWGPDKAVVWDGSVAGIRTLIEEIGSPALGICLDTGHGILEGWDNAQAVRVAGDLLIATHIADNDGSGDQHRIPFSYGSTVDWPAVVAALEAIGYGNAFNLEIPGERGRPLEILDAVIRYGLEVSRKLLAGGVGAVLPR